MESQALIAPVRFESGRPMLLAGLRRYHPFAAAEATLAAQWREHAALGPLPGQVGVERFGVGCGHDDSGFEYMCAVEVASLADLPVGTGRMRAPAQRYAVFTHEGALAGLLATWTRILAWLEQGDWQSAHAPDFERYGPDTDPLAGGAPIEIWVGVVPR